MSETPPQAVFNADMASRSFEQPAFAALRKAGSPSIMLRGHDPYLCWANRAAADLFDVAGYDGLSLRLAGGKDWQAASRISYARQGLGPLRGSPG